MNGTSFQASALWADGPVELFEDPAGIVVIEGGQICAVIPDPGAAASEYILRSL